MSPRRPLSRHPLPEQQRELRLIKQRLMPAQAQKGAVRANHSMKQTTLWRAKKSTAVSAGFYTFLNVKPLIHIDISLHIVDLHVTQRSFKFCKNSKFFGTSSFSFVLSPFILPLLKTMVMVRRESKAEYVLSSCLSKGTW